MEKKKRKHGANLIADFIFVVCGAGLGILLGILLARLPEGILDEKDTLRITALFFIILTYCLQLIIHEAGHLVFGLISGYSFSSFRVGSLMLLKENGKLKFRRLTIAGTGGQCLMAPPEMKDGDFPVVLYNLGGSLLNLLASLLFLLLMLVCPKDGICSMFCFLMIVTGLLTGLINGIPLHTKTIDNDGYNAISMRKSKDARHGFWLQMKINEQISQGKRLKDMPEEWFQMPEDAAMQNSLVASVGVSVCNRLMDQHRFAEADARMAHLLEIDSAMVGIHRNLMICDRIYLELIHENRAEVLEGFYSKEQKQFMKAMRNFPTVIRTEYAYALLQTRDFKAAEKAMTSFEKVARTYPYPTDILSERELIQIAKEKANPITE